MMRIVHVINSMARGGAEAQLLELVRRSSLDHDVIELDRLLPGRVSAMLRLSRAVDRRRPVVTVAWLERPQIALGLTPTPPRPMVACIRALPNPPRATHAWRLRLALARFDALVANSEASRSAMRAFGRPFEFKDFTVIPNGVELLPATARRSPQRPLRIGFIGRAPDPDKGLDVLLSALEMLQHEVAATLIGSGVPEASAGTRHIAMPAVADPWSFLRDADAIVVPSRREGSPNVVLEAFARTVPVIGTSAGGTAELLAGERGLIVPPEDPVALANAMSALAQDWEAARERAERARAYVEREHGWPQVLEAFDSLFVRLADHGRPRPHLPLLPSSTRAGSGRPKGRNLSGTE